VQAELELLERPTVITLRHATIFRASPRIRIDLLVNHFVYAALTDGYIVIFEKDFERNYIHVRDGQGAGGKSAHRSPLTGFTGSAPNNFLSMKSWNADPVLLYVLLGLIA
jgi:hypothetical protein